MNPSIIKKLNHILHLFKAKMFFVLVKIKCVNLWPRVGFDYIRTYMYHVSPLKIRHVFLFPYLFLFYMKNKIPNLQDGPSSMGDLSPPSPTMTTTTTMITPSPPLLPYLLFSEFPKYSLENRCRRFFPFLVLDVENCFISIICIAFCCCWVW